MINCPKCGARTGVYDSRISFEGNTRRKRLCPKCSHRFATIEIIDGGRPLETRKPKAPVAKKVKPARVPKKTAPKRAVEKKVKRFDDEGGDYEDSFVDDFEDVVKELGIGGLNEYD
jgi:transcriptional regulator NrdR family protein